MFRKLLSSHVGLASNLTPSFPSRLYRTSSRLLDARSEQPHVVVGWSRWERVRRETARSAVQGTSSRASSVPSSLSAFLSKSSEGSNLISPRTQWNLLRRPSGTRGTRVGSSESLGCFSSASLAISIRFETRPISSPSSLSFSLLSSTSAGLAKAAFVR